MGRAKRERDFWESAALNNATYIQYYNRLVELAISMFEWKNLPETVDARFLELTLFSRGQAVFFYDEALGFLALPNARGGPFDVYGIPITRRAYSCNGYNADLTAADSVIIWNNNLHKNSQLDAEMYARRLWNYDRAIDVNVNAQKTPILLLCDENERLTMENLYKQYDGNKPVIKGVSGLSTQGFTVLKTDAPFVADRLYELKTQYWNEALTFLGISNVNFTKKERLNTMEVARNLGGTVASRYSRIEARRNACDEINKMFGLDISCDFREDFQELAEAEEQNNMEEGGDPADE